MENETLPQIITEEMRTAVQKALKEMSWSFSRSEADSDLRKDISNNMKENFGIPKREFNKLAKIYHASALAEEARKTEEFMEFAEALLTTNTNTIVSDTI